MIKKKLNIIILIIAILTLGCRKITHKTDVSGVVYDATTTTVLSHAHVYLLKENGSCFSCNPAPYMDTYTNSDGGFSFNYKAEKGYTYSLGASATNYFDQQSGIIYVDSDKNNKKEKILLNPHAYLKLHIKNTSPFDGSDEISVNFISHPFSFYGTAVDTILTVQAVFGNVNNSIYWGVKKNGVITNNSSSVYCSAFDTTLYNLNY